MKIFKFEVEEGKTQGCYDCPFGRISDSDYGEYTTCENGLDDIFDCEKYDLRTLKLVEDNETD